MATAALFEAGKPGGYASRLAWRARLRAAGCAALSAAALLLALSNRPALAGGAPGAYLPIGALIAATLAGAFARQFWGRSLAAAVGARSERRVAAVLRAQRGTALLHSVELGVGGDADHLLLGPHLVAVETKTGAGKVSYQDGKIYVGTKALRGDPVAQCRRQAMAAKQVCGSFCDAVVCVVDMVNAPFTVGSVHVCSAADLPAVLAGLPHRVRSEQAWARAVELAPRCSTIHAKGTGGSPSTGQTSNQQAAARTPTAAPIAPQPVLHRPPTRAANPVSPPLARPRSGEPAPRKLTPRRTSPPK
jgi:hypothetical protein